MKKLLITALSLASTSALAHSGHLPSDTVHGFLHIEHIIVLVTVGVIACAVTVLRNK